MFAALADAVLGDASANQRALAVQQTIRQRLRQSSPAYTDYDNSADAFYGTLCADAEFPDAFRDFHRIGAWAEHGSFLAPPFWWQNVPCANWPASADRYVGPWTARTSAPVLIVGNLFDGITGYEGALASNKLLPNSRLLTYAGWGHTAFSRSACVTEHVLTYLLDGTLPPEGTVCPANPNPFAPSAPAPAAAARRAVATDDVRAPMVGLPPSWRH